MFTNIGGKIKGLAKLLCWLGIVVSVIAGIIMIITGVSADIYWLTLGGVAVIFIGPLSSWVGSFLLYGFGELVHNSSILAEAAKKAE